MKTNAANERIKHQYFTFLVEARRLNEQSVDAVAKALDRFESYTTRKDFKAFHRQQAIAFKQHLANQLNMRTSERLSKSTVYSTLTALKAFFLWLAGQPGYKSRLQYSDAEFFNLSLKDTAVAKSIREPRVPTIDQIRLALSAMPTTSSIDKRNRALVAFILLTGARDNAVASLRLKHVDLVERVVVHDPRDVRVKFSKTFSTYFFPVGDDIESIVVEWVEYLRTVEGFGPNDALFPATAIVLGPDGNFTASGLRRDCWADAAPIRAVFKAAFEDAGMTYYNPHSLRKTLVRLGMEVCRTPEEFKAWAQNLGHDDVLTTFRSYGDIPTHRQRDLIRAASDATSDDVLALELGRNALRTMRNSL
jgi:integrase